MPDDARFPSREYADACASSFDRCQALSRWILLFCALAAVVYWNARPGNWTRVRLQLYQAAAAFQDSTMASHPSGEPAGEAAWLARAIPPDMLQERLRALRSADADRLRFRVPILDLPMDVNDLSLVLGIVFAVGIWTLRAALRHYRESLALTFREAQEAGVLRVVADLVAMRTQSIWLRPAVQGRARVTRFARRLLYVIPPCLLLAVYLDDLLTMHVGVMLYGSSVVLRIGLGGLLLAMLLWATVLMLRDFSSIDSIWMRTESEVREEIARAAQQPAEAGGRRGAVSAVEDMY